MKCEIRRLQKGDIDAIISLDRLCFDREWTKEQYFGDIDHPGGFCYGYFENDRLVGAIFVRFEQEEACVFRIMSHPETQRRGIAKRLLLYVVEALRSKQSEVSMLLEVNANNAGAISFYRELGFKEIGIRKGYYPRLDSTLPAEDALVMKAKFGACTLTYALVDSGEGVVLERFGKNTIVRPRPEANWPTHVPQREWYYQAICRTKGLGQYAWETSDGFIEPWYIDYGPLRFELRLSQSKNIGIFPEQVDNWRWIADTIRKANNTPKILNLFAYTGAATLVAALAGAEVCHVDSSKAAVKRASHNQQLSGLSHLPIRWIVDDAMAFLRRELVRGVKYDGVILDPPPFGHGGKGFFTFRKQVTELLDMCKRVLRPDPLLFLLNCYAMGLPPKAARDFVRNIYPQAPIAYGELVLAEEKRAQEIPCSIYARFRRI